MAKKPAKLLPKPKQVPPAPPKKAPKKEETDLMYMISIQKTVENQINMILNQIQEIKAITDLWVEKDAEKYGFRIKQLQVQKKKLNDSIKQIREDKKHISSILGKLKKLKGDKK